MMEWMKKLFGGRVAPETRMPANAGEMEVAMSDATKTETPPAASGGITHAEVSKIVQEAVAGAIGAAIKPLQEAMGKAVTLEAMTKAIGEAVGKISVPPGLKTEDLQKLVAEGIQAQQASVQKEAQTKAAQDAIATKRKAFAAENLKNVPARYHGELGDDESKWAEGAKTIRSAFADDMKTAGIKIPDVGGAQGGEAVAGKSAGGFLKMPATAAAPAAS
jgi:hypothetical protein